MSGGGRSWERLPGLELSVVMPCLDEAETLATCIQKAQAALREHAIAGEIVVADNGSSDGSREIAARLGARVVPVETRGYGAALMGGIQAANGRFVIMADADDSYDFTQLMPFLAKLREGFDLVIGNRFLGGILPGAMPPLHRYLGNPVLTGIGRLFFNSPCGDFHCGMRGFRRDAVLALDLQTTGMEFASEMVVKATLLGMRVTEVPTTLSPDGRSRPPHLRSWRDGWRHLRFLMLFSPRWLFLYPGALLMLIGVVTGAWLLPEQRTIGGVVLQRAHAPVRRRRHPDRFPVDRLRGLREGLRDQRRPAPRGSSLRQAGHHHHAGVGPGGGLRLRRGRARGHVLGALRLGRRVVRGARSESGAPDRRSRPRWRSRSAARSC